MASFEKSQKDAALDKAAEDILENLANNLMSQTPKIDTALKNLVAYYLGHQQTQGGRNPSTLMPNVLKVIQTLSKAIQSVDLMPPQEWASSIPQGDESATERLNAIAKYKVIYTLRNKIINSGNKVTKSLGYDYFTGTKYIWKKIKESVFTSLSPSSPEVAEIAEEVLELFENSLAFSCDPLSTLNNDADGRQDGSSNVEDQARKLRVKLGLDVSMSTSEIKDLCDLIWASDFNEALRARRIKRASSISERLRKEEEDDSSRESQSDGHGDGGSTGISCGSNSSS